MKKFLSLACALALTLSCLAGALPVAAAETATTTGKTYYVSNRGVGGNDGSQANPFPSLDAVQWDALQPGDTVLLEKGSTFDGFIHLKDISGTVENPIKIGAYGEASAPKPIINGKGQGIWYQDYGQPLDNRNHKYQGYVSSTILLYDCDFIEVSGLEITNAVPNEAARFISGEEQTLGAGIMDRTGVAGAAKNGGVMEHIYLNDLYIHDVNGNIQDKHMDNGGIQLNALKPVNESATGVARYDDVKITNCRVEKVSRAGICVGYTYQWSKFQGSTIADGIAQKFGHTNLYIANNYVKDAGNDAIVALYAYAPLVEKNIADHPGADLPIYEAGDWQRFCAGIWPWKCKDAVFQYNEVFNTEGQGNGDGQAFDIDWSDGTIYQYNYSHNNAKGPILFCLDEAYNGVYRYNLSQDDLGCYMTLQGNPNALIYNNVFYSGAGKSVRILHESGGKNNGNAWIANNIFYSVDTKTITDEDNWNGSGGKKTYTHNLYYNFSATPVGEEGAVVVPTGSGDTIFVDPGKAPTATTTPGIISARTAFDGFKLAENSPAIEKGIFVENSGGMDFFGAELDNTPDIGIHNVPKHVIESDSTIKTSLFEVTGQTIQVPITALSQSTVQNLLDGVTVAKTSTKAVVNADDVAQAGTTILTSGMKLVITAEDQSTNTYTVAVKNTYNYKNDFVGGKQGNVWFAQRQSSVYGQMENIAAYYEPWKCWQERADENGTSYWFVGLNDGVAPTKGAMCANASMAVAMAFRAPVDGVVSLSFPAQAQFRTKASQTSVFITLNGNQIGKSFPVPTNIENTTEIPTQMIKVSKGDYLRIETRGGAESIAITPEITYQETTPAITTTAYTIDHENKTIEHVAYGTTKADFLQNFTLAQGTSIKLMDGETEVADGVAVASGMRMELTVNTTAPVYYTITVLPKAPTGYQELDRTGWTAFAGTEHSAVPPNEGPAQNVLDGNIDSRWHTAWDGEPNAKDPARAWIAINMREKKTVARIGYQARQTQSAGNFYSYVVETSEDGTTWTKISDGTWDRATVDGDRSLIHYAEFEPVTTQYIRIRATVSNGDHGCASEIYIAEPTYN